MLVAFLLLFALFDDSAASNRAKRYYDFTLTIPGKVINISGKHPLITLIEMIPWAISGAPMDKFPLMPANTLNWLPHFGSQHH
ncbi:hypothetical protein QR680_017595 [Steinernema hermaphroditum]|uniref:Carboxylesterase type B domain-containing protein n=1 Tax=Steinernema hermaphroditum TaxID=289476 RepID=A0AA39HFS0_9BILA|nr:hypothetical protein QR680_017595 [Steinernema hermaphroditum]